MNPSSGSLGSPSEYVTVLNPNDVLFGRGSGPNDHEGNIRFRSLVSERKAEYMATNHRQTKAKIAREIVSNVLNKSGRFLKKVEAADAKRLGIPKGVDAWISVDEETIMEKAKQALRQQRDKARSRSPTASPGPVAGGRKTAAQVEAYVAANARYAAAATTCGASQDALRRSAAHMQSVAAELNSAYAQAHLLHPNPYEPIPIGSVLDQSTLEDWRSYATAAVLAQTQGLQQDFVLPTPELEVSNMMHPASQTKTKRDVPDTVQSRRESLQVHDLMDSFNNLKTKEHGDYYSSNTMSSKNHDSTDTMETIDPLPIGPVNTSMPLSGSIGMSSSTFSLMKGALNDSSRIAESSLYKGAPLQDSAIDPSIFKSDSSIMPNQGTRASLSSRSQGSGSDRRSSRGSIHINDKDFFKKNGTSSDFSNMSMSLSQVWTEKRPLKDVTEEQNEDGQDDGSQKQDGGGADRDFIHLEDDNMSGLGKSSMSILNVAMGESQGESIMTANESIFSDIGD